MNDPYVEQIILVKITYPQRYIHENHIISKLHMQMKAISHRVNDPYVEQIILVKITYPQKYIHHNHIISKLHMQMKAISHRVNDPYVEQIILFGALLGYFLEKFHCHGFLGFISGRYSE